MNTTQPPGGLRRISAARPSNNGFTLIEVLTVIAIISVLLTAGAIGLGNISAGKDTAAAIATCDSLFQEARTLAISNQCNARVMIDSDPDSETYLRRISIVRNQISPTGAVDPNTWVLSSRGYLMPKGIFYSQLLSTNPDSSARDEESVSPVNETGGTMTNYAGEHLFYTFNSQGIISKPGARFIIGSGIRLPGADPKTKSGERDFAGFVIWRNGSTSTFRSPEQMELPTTPSFTF